MSTFFTVPGKRKRPSNTDGPKKRLATSIVKGPAKASKPVLKQRRERDESISGSDSESEGAPGNEEFNGLGSDSEGEEETAAEKRLRLAERYLDTTRKEVDDLVGFNAEDVDRDLIAERLKEDVSEAKGKVYRLLADELNFGKASHTMFRCDTHTTTSVSICAPYCYTVSKDLCMIQWKLQDIPANQYPQTTKKKPKRQAPPRKKPTKINILKGNKNKSKEKGYQGHTGEILCVRASSDGKFV
jgi:ribosomal RNA-processing protein 9